MSFHVKSSNKTTAINVFVVQMK